MNSILILILIYMSFISLGLPDSLLGSSWPVMHSDLDVDISLLGCISFTICLGTIVSSVIYAKIHKFIKPGVLDLFCTFLTSSCLLLISETTEFALLLPLAFILGLGAGSIDACLNDYVALNYKARHMSFLHASWGIGTIFGPTLLSWLFSRGYSWRLAYKAVFCLQFLMALVFLATVSKWEKVDADKTPDDGVKQVVSIKEIMKIRGVGLSMLAAFLYCSIEATTFTWIASFMNVSRFVIESDAALMASMVYWGITVGRICTGMVNDRLGDDIMIITGLCITFAAAVSLCFLDATAVMMVACFLVGFGFGPVYPSLLHQTPYFFKGENSTSIMGLLMASAYVGSASMPLLYGVLVKLIDNSLLILLLMLFTVFQICIFFRRRHIFNNQER